MTEPNPLPFEEWMPDRSDRQNPAAEAKGVYSVAGQYAPFPDYQQYGPSSTVDSFTKILLHMDGADATTSFPDDAPTTVAHAWTAAGNAQVDTADSKFGGASLLLDGTGDWVTTVDSADYTLGSNDWTVDFWFKTTAAGGFFMFMAGQGDSGGVENNNTSVVIYRRDTNVISCMARTTGVSNTVTGVTPFTNALNTGWHHL